VPERGTTWTRVATGASILGLFVAGGGLFFSGRQLEVANDQARQNANATELQSFSDLNRQLHDPSQLKRVGQSVRILIQGATDSRLRSLLNLRDVQPIIALAAQYDHIAKLLLADQSVLPHARQLFAEDMACIALDYQSAARMVKGLHLQLLEQLAQFTRGTSCRSVLSIGGFGVGLPSGG
jgi:hypothetical protein